VENREAVDPSHTPTHCEDNSQVTNDLPFTLLGMAPTGEACVVRDDADRVWVSSIYAPIRQVDPDDVDQLIGTHDWNRIDEQFATWPALEAYRNDHSRMPPPRFPDLADYDADEIRDVLEETETAHSDEERQSSRSLLLDILAQCPVILSDSELRAAVIDRLRELTEPERATATVLQSPAQADAMDRLQLVAA
jgi:hypothetical protein